MPQMDILKTLLCIYLFIAFHPSVAGLHISRLIVDDQDEFDIFDGIHVQAVQGQNITLIGWYDNLEAPMHMFNGKPIRKSEKYRMEWSENQLVLTITNLTAEYINEIRQQLLMWIRTIADISEMQIFAYQRLFDHIAKSEEHTRAKKMETTFFAVLKQERNDKIKRLMEIVQNTPKLDVMGGLLKRSIVSFEKDVISYSYHYFKILSEVEEEKSRVWNLNRSNEEQKQENIQLQNKVEETTSIFRRKLKKFRDLLETL